MKTKKIFKGLIACSIIFSLSCTKDFSQLNTNPNTSEKVLAENLLARAIAKTVENNMNRSRGFTNELMQVTVNTLVETDRVFRYDIRRNTAEGPWNGWYAQLTNFKDIYKFAEENVSATENVKKAYQGISLICQAWVYSMITDTYGDIPYSESVLGKEGVYTPKFDAQKDIYIDLLQKLEDANTLLTGLSNVTEGNDPLYQGRVAQWRKFGNSLYLRLLLRVAHKTDLGFSASDKIKDIVEVNPNKYPIFVSNDDSAVMKWTGAVPYQSPFYNMQNSDWAYPRACSFFVDLLADNNDPCLSRFVATYQGGYEGIPSGYTYGETPVSKSALANLRTEPLLGNIINYAEVQFILAEAAQNGWITSKTPKEYYDAGITARITFWGRTVGTYLNEIGIAWNTGESAALKMEKIQLQKYMALFYTDVQQWVEYRRSGSTFLPAGPGLRNDGVMPTRLFYPLSIQATNRTNYDLVVASQGADDLKTLMWWQKP